ncbi:hypothetical protein [Amycolatopsis sp. NPDC004378]
MFTAGAVVVEIDDARTCWLAVRWAAGEAGRRGRELVVAHPVTPGFVIGYPEAAVALAGGDDRLALHLNRLVAGVASEHPGLPVSGIVLEPTPTALAELVTAVQATVLVVGPGRRGHRVRERGAPLSWSMVQAVPSAAASGGRRGGDGGNLRPATALGVRVRAPTGQLGAHRARLVAADTASVRAGLHTGARVTLVTDLAAVLAGYPGVPFDLVPVRDRACARAARAGRTPRSWTSASRSLRACGPGVGRDPWPGELSARLRSSPPAKQKQSEQRSSFRASGRMISGASEYRGIGSMPRILGEGKGVGGFRLCSQNL